MNDILMHLMSIIWPFHLAAGVCMAKVLDIANNRRDTLFTYILTIIVWPLVVPIRLISIFLIIQRIRKNQNKGSGR